MQPLPPETPTSTRVRLYSHMTQSRFLHVEDSLEIGKLRLFGGNYRKQNNAGDGGSMTSHVTHYMDVADARVVFHALLNGEANFTYKEYKGTQPPDGGPVVSRVLSVAIKGDNVYIELTSGPGKPTPTGAIMPNGRPDAAVNVGFKLYEARRLAAAVLAYLNAWDVMRMMANRHAVSRPAAYLLTPTAANGNGAAKPNGATQSAAVNGAANGRPVTRHGPPAPRLTAPPQTAVVNGGGKATTSAKATAANGAAKTAVVQGAVKTTAPSLPQTAVANGAHNAAAPAAKPASANGQPPPAPPAAQAAAQALYAPNPAPAKPAVNAPPLAYKNGDLVNAANAAEADTFRRFVTAKKRPPADRNELGGYYRQLNGVPML
jgi:hypothetical protein